MERINLHEGDSGAAPARRRRQKSKLAVGALGVHLFLVDLMKRTREEVASTIEAFVNGTGRQWDWDGFTSIRLDDPELEAVRLKCVSLPAEYPPTTRAEYCSPAGMQVMRELLESLRAPTQGAR